MIWVLADWLAQLSGHNPLVNPVMIAIAAISAILLATGTSYGTYFTGAQFIHFLLGPTTVAIAIPLYKNWPLVRHKVLPLLAALIAGTATSILSAIAVGAALGLPRDVLISLAPKSVTAPVAMSLSAPAGRHPRPDGSPGRHHRRAGRRGRDAADECDARARLCGARLCRRS